MNKLFKTALCLTIASASYSQVSFEEFLLLKQSLKSAFNELRANDNHVLNVNKPFPGFENYWWNLEQPHASYVREEIGNIINHNIYLFGGYARLEGMTLDGLALTACHEIAHGIGGAPYKTSGSSTEGQSDYYATKTCLPIVFKYLKQTRDIANDSFIKNNCKTELCARSLTAIQSSISFFEHLGDYTSFETPSLEVSYEINRSPSYYPSSQCRIDTYVRGALGKQRPQCWFTEEDM